MTIREILDSVFRAGFKSKVLGREDHAEAIKQAEAKIKALVNVNDLDRVVTEFLNAGERSYGFKRGTSSDEDDTMLLAETLKQHIDSL